MSLPSSKNNTKKTVQSKQVPVTDGNAREIKIALPFLRHITIESKLKFGFGILFIIILITSALSIIGLEYVRSHYEYAVHFGLKLETLSLEAQKELLQARRREKDFLLRWQTSGFQQAKSKYLKQNTESIENVRKICRQILAILPQDEKAANWALKDSADALNKEINVYSKEFKQLVNLIEIQGFNDTGLEGHFRQDAHEVEEGLLKGGLNTAELELLRLRRHEKDYLLRGHRKYVKKVSDTLLILRQHINKSQLPEKEKEKLNITLDDYWLTFDKLIAIKQKVSKVTEDFRFVAHQIEEATERFRTIGHEEAENYLKDAKLGAEETKAMVYSSIIVLMVLGFLLSYLLASHIRTPLHLLDETVKRIHQGNHNARAPVVTSDETGRLAIAFNEMSNNLNKAMADIKEKSTEIDEQRKLSERLLRNILPNSIASRLKEEETIAEWYGQVTILFADIVGFTKLSALLSATELVSRLNTIFSKFDELTEKYGLEKIKTMGDCYMAAGGLPEACEQHAELVADLALELIPALEEINQHWGQQVKIRIGMNTGPVVAGVIGKSKFVYDLWGDAVNIASRMESHGVVGRIQVSESTYRLLEEKYNFEERGLIDIKGKGTMSTYLLTGKKKCCDLKGTLVNHIKKYIHICQIMYCLKKHPSYSCFIESTIKGTI